MKLKRNIRSNKPLKINKRNFAWILVALLVGVQVLFAVQSATAGARLAELEYEEKELMKGNQELSQFIVESSSLSEMEETADELGFAKPDTTYYLTLEELVAQLP
jgi:hypothetical protein